MYSWSVLKVKRWRQNWESTKAVLSVSVQVGESFTLLRNWRTGTSANFRWRVRSVRRIASISMLPYSMGKTHPIFRRIQRHWKPQAVGDNPRLNERGKANYQYRWRDKGTSPLHTEVVSTFTYSVYKVWKSCGRRTIFNFLFDYVNFFVNTKMS